MIKRNSSLGGQIGLVTNQQLVDIVRCISVNLVEPLLDVVETLQVSDVINYNNTMGAAVVAGCDRSEALLTSSVPLFIGYECISEEKILIATKSE